MVIQSAIILHSGRSHSSKGGMQSLSAMPVAWPSGRWVDALKTNQKGKVFASTLHAKRSYRFKSRLLCLCKIDEGSGARDQSHDQKMARPCAPLLLQSVMRLEPASLSQGWFAPSQSTTRTQRLPSSPHTLAPVGASSAHSAARVAAEGRAPSASASASAGGQAVNVAGVLPVCVRSSGSRLLDSASHSRSGAAAWGHARVTAHRPR